MFETFLKVTAVNYDPSIEAQRHMPVILSPCKAETGRSGMQGLLGLRVDSRAA